jgi:hypothetical protein
MKLPEKLIQSILTVTVMIQSESPELYQQLSETPLFLSYKNMEICKSDFENYLESIQIQLKTAENINLPVLL